MNSYKLRGWQHKTGTELMLLAAAQEKIETKCRDHRAQAPFRMVRITGSGKAVEPGAWYSVAEGMPHWSGRLAGAKPDETYRIETKGIWKLYIYIRPATKGQIIVSAALSQLGVPYVFGTENPDTGPGDTGAFDCSGFTDWCYNRVGVDLPHQADAQMRMNNMTYTTNPQLGDLVFFNYPSSPKPSYQASHVGIFYKDGYLIDTRHPYTEPVAIRAIEKEYVLHYGYIKGVTHT